jgi:NAD+ synthase (glutamine-hydrolysing)
LFCAKDGTKLALTFGEDENAPISAAALAAMAGAEIVVEMGAENAQIGARQARRNRLLTTSETAVCAHLRVSAGKDESTADLVYAGEAMMALNGSMIAENANVVDGDYLLVADLDLGRVRYDRRHNRTFAAACARYASEYECVSCDGARCASNGELLALSRLPFIPDHAKERETRAEEIFEIQAQGLARRLSVVGGKLVIGISGGLDSTLAVLVAVRAMRMLGLPATNVTAVTMPCFGTTDETLRNALELMETLGVTTRTVSIKDAVMQHFKDIGHDPSDFSVTYENAQARERTQVLMDIANQVGGIVLGTGDLSELALGWCTYNGDHMSMYGVNADVPKTLVRWVITALAGSEEFAASAAVLKRILDTPISPELLPPDAVGKIAQKTEDIVGPYALHDFFLFWSVRYQYAPTKLFEMAKIAFAGVFDGAVIKKWLTVFWRRFFGQQFKRNCLPDGVKVGSVGLSPRGDWQMPSDAAAALWLQEIENIDA